MTRRLLGRTSGEYTLPTEAGLLARILYSIPEEGVGEVAVVTRLRNGPQESGESDAANDEGRRLSCRPYIIYHGPLAVAATRKTSFRSLLVLQFRTITGTSAPGRRIACFQGSGVGRWSTLIHIV
jgi:hypothetical protein